MAQQTAVEWLVNEIIFKSEYEHLPNNYFLMSDKDIDKIIIQAKEMEKEQMHKFASFWRGKENDIEKPIFEIYYNETFKK
jgi:hypothetical protein